VLLSDLRMHAVDLLHARRQQQQQQQQQVDHASAGTHRPAQPVQPAAAGPASTSAAKQQPQEAALLPPRDKLNAAELQRAARLQQRLNQGIRHMAMCLLQDQRLRSVLPTRRASRASGGGGLPPRSGGAPAVPLAPAAQAQTLQHVAQLASAGHYQDLETFTADVARVCQAVRCAACWQMVVLACLPVVPYG
jgi:hypothetical protein